MLGTVDTVYSRLRSFACRANSMFTNPRHNDVVGVLNSEKERGSRAVQSSAALLLFDLTVL